MAGSAVKLMSGGLKKENEKLEQDIAEMQSALYHQKTRLINDSSIRSQSGKATRNSKWVSGAKGQISGYRSHKGLSDKNLKESAEDITRSQNVRVPSSRRGRTQSFNSLTETRKETVTKGTVENNARAGSREPVKASTRIKSAPVRRGSARKPEKDTQHARALSLQGGINSLQTQKINKNQKEPQTGKLCRNGERKVSFDLSDDESPQINLASATDQVFDQGAPIIKATRSSASISGSKTPEMGSYADRIAQLKARVIAKANANLKPEVLTNLSREGQNDSANVAVYRTSTSKPGNREKTGNRASAANSKMSSEQFRDAKGSQSARKNKGSISKNRQVINKDKNLQHEDRASHKQEVVQDCDSLLDASVELWLCSLQLEDSLECVKIFRRYQVTMDNLSSLTESQLVMMGITSKTTLRKILEGIEKLHQVRKVSPRTSRDTDSALLRTSGYDNGIIQTTKLSDLIDTERFEEVLTIKNSTQPSTNRSPRITSSSWTEGTHDAASQSHRPSSKEALHEEKEATKTEDSSEGHPSPDLCRRNSSSKIEIERTNSDKGSPKKKGRVLSANVVNRTLTSGVQSAMTKLRQKQEQELNEQKRQERLRRAKKAERDKMALQHARRQREKLEQMQAEAAEEVAAEVEEDIQDLEGESSSPDTSRAFQLHEDSSGEGHLAQTQDVIKISIQGGALFSKTLSSNVKDQDDSEMMAEAPKVPGSPRQTPEERLKDLELNIQGLQGRESQATTSSQLEMLQQQLLALKKDLTVAGEAVSSSGSAEPGHASMPRAQSAIKTSSGPSRAVYSSMSKNELMKEVRKQKEQHKKQIRRLESELSRLKHRDPVRSCELPEGDILYREEDLIGEGTFSQVFRGYFNGSEVAIKKLKIPLDTADHNYFAEEVSLLHELRHPRIILLLGVCTSGRLPLMVLEHMAGGSVFDRIHDKSREILDHITYYQITRDIALGMNYLHRHRPQVLHLDLKSMNVLLGLHGRAKIGDFGFAKLRHEAEALEKGKVQGTPAWMAPELMANVSNSLTDKADVYSFGVILWEMFTGAQPYKGLSVFQVLEAVQQKKRPEIPESCPQPLTRLIKACWDHKPNKRPSFKDILIALEALAFPPEWRSLLSAADIPREALEDPTSARSIIALVNNSVQLTQRELDQLALASHERVMGIANPGGSGNQESCMGNQMALREKLPSELLADDVEEDIDYDSLDEDVNPIRKQFKPQEDNIRPRVQPDSSQQKLTPRGRFREDKEDTVPKRTPRHAREDTSTHSSANRQEIPIAPPINPMMLLSLSTPKPSLLTPPNPRQTTSTRNRPSQDLPAGHTSVDPNALLEQRKHLRSTKAGPHPSQLPSLSELGEQQITSIAEILRKAVAVRRTALREDGHSMEYPNSESLWSTANDDN